jgi:hypothetical protein
MALNNDKMLKKGTRVYLALKGHRNFNYPTEECETLLEDTEAESLHWAGGGTKVAFKIPASSIYPTQQFDKKICVWVEKK